MSKFQLTPITGLPQVDGWAQVISHPSGSLFCVLAVQGQHANSVGRNLSELLLGKDISDSAQLHNLILDLLQVARTELCKIQLACLVFADNNKVIAATHSGSVFLKRNSKVGEILQSDSELKIIEGNLQKNDLFSLTTQDAKNNFTSFKEKLISNNIETLATDLVAELQEKTQSSLIAIGFLEEKPALEPGPQQPPNNKKTNQEIIAKKWSLLKNKLTKINLNRVRSLAQNLPKKLWQKPTVFAEKIESEQTKTPQVFLKVAFLLITIFVGVIFWKQQTIKQELEPITPILAEIDARFEIIKNDQTTSDIQLRDNAKELMRELENLIATNKDKKYSLEEIKKYYQEIQAFADSISGVENQAKLDPFFDLRLAEPEFVAKRVSLSNNQLFALDASGKYGIYLNLENKQANKINFEQLELPAKNISLSDNLLFVLGNGIHLFDLEQENTHTKLKDEGDSDRDGSLFQTYGSYLYIINPEKRNIYRYLLKDDKLSEPIGWLLDKQDLDFSNLESISVDGDLWLTDKTGRILKYTQGQKQTFEPQSLPSPLGKNIKLSTTENSNYLYILDRDQHKVVILQKDGLFVKELSSDSLSAGDTIVALEEKEGALVVSGSLIYEILP
ncbi:MAG: hypothetical protein IT416_02025 [Candidatus Pacebacteria bacterium]|nr:hypothetical protein [Candidatus Paceibacterota bacterium]